MPYYPICLDLKGKNCLVVGGGKVALRKIKGLLECGASVAVVAPEISKQVKELVNPEKCKIIERKFAPEDLNNITLVYAATDDRKTNEEIFNRAQEKKILVNVVDAPELCNFIVPSTLKRDELLISISTGGKTPALAKKLREEMERLFPENFGEALDDIEELRREIREKFPGQEEREKFWREFMNFSLLDELIKNNNPVKERIDQCRSSW